MSAYITSSLTGSLTGPALQPQHTHDCEHCRFVGRAGGHDLYIHPQDAGDHSLIRRFGSQGEEYGCWKATYGNVPPDYRAILIMAQRQGLV